LGWQLTGGIAVKKKVVSTGRPKSLRSKRLSPKREAGVKGGSATSGAGSGKVEHSEFTIKKYFDR